MHPTRTRPAWRRIGGVILAATAAGTLYCIFCFAEAWAAANAPSPNTRIIPNQVIIPRPANPNQPANPANPNQPPPNNANNANRPPAGQAGGGIRTATITFTGTGAALTGAPTGARVAVRTSAVTFTGTGAVLTAPPSTAGTVTIRSGPINFTGTGSM